jgi:hypothetical protein
MNYLGVSRTGKTKQLSPEELAARLQEVLDGQSMQNVISACLGMAVVTTVAGAAVSGAVPPDPDAMNRDIENLVVRISDILKTYVSDPSQQGS